MRILLILVCSSSLFGQILSGVIVSGGSGIPPTVANPTTSNSGGSCSGSDGAGWSCSGTTTVSMADATSGATILYTNNGSTPACPSTGTSYSSGISTAATTTYKMIGCKTGYTDSSVVTVVYTIGGGGGITYISTCHGAAGSPSGGGVPAVLTGVDCTGATTIIIVASDFSSTPVTDSVVDGTNTYTQRGTGYANGGGAAVGIYDAVGITGGASMTFTVTGSYSSFCVMGFSGVTAFDQVTGNTNNVPGSLTAASANSLYITGVSSQSDPTTPTASGGYTVPDVLNNNSGKSLAVGCGYLIQSGGPTAVNPTWDFGGGVIVSTQATYVP